MPCPVPKYRPTFSSEELDRARDVVRRRNAPHAMVQRAKAAIKPSTGAASLAEYDGWTTRYGTGM